MAAIQLSRPSIHTMNVNTHVELLEYEN